MALNKLKKLTPGNLRALLARFRAHPQLTLSELPLAGGLIAAAAPVRRPPVLILSLPRSGSSWIGRIVGTSERALYLREPMTQLYLDRIGRDAPSVVFEWSVCKDQAAYMRTARRAFRGTPTFRDGITAYPNQWALLGRARRQVVVKEVNPLVVEQLWERFKPKIIFLLRHPVPVARSAETLGWKATEFRARFSPETIAALERKRPLPHEASTWEQRGAIQCIVENLVCDFLSKVEHTIVRYEDVCKDPIGEFGRIFDFCGLPLSSATREEIQHSSQAQLAYRPIAYQPGRYDTNRNSIEMADQWKRDLDQEAIDKVRRGYFAYEPIFYRQESDWGSRPRGAETGARQEAGNAGRSLGAP